MKQIDFYYDPISPYAYLAFEQLPRAMEGLSYSVQYIPVFLGGVLKHWGQLGPAEIEPKRLWTYRQMCWQAEQLQIPLDIPATHPFNPLGLLRLLIACGEPHQTLPDASMKESAVTHTNRYITESALRFVWHGGQDAADSQRLQALNDKLQPPRAATGEDIKTELRHNTDFAIAQGVFGVPSMVVDGQLFWGLDSFPMLRIYLEKGEILPAAIWNAGKNLTSGIPLRK